MIPEEEKGNEQSGRTCLESSTTDTAAMNQSAMADLSQRQDAISGEQELQFGSQHAAAEMSGSAVLWGNTAPWRGTKPIHKSALHSTAWEGRAVQVQMNKFFTLQSLPSTESCSTVPEMSI